MLDALGDHLNTDGGQQQAHDPGGDVKAGDPQPPANGLGQAQGHPDHKGHHEDTGADQEAIGQGRGALTLDHHQTDGAGSGKQGNGQRHHGHVFPVAVRVLLFRAALGPALLGMHHGNGHEQDQQSAADTKRGDADPEKGQQGIAYPGGNHQHDGHGNSGHPGNGPGLGQRSVAAQGKKNRYGAQRIDYGENTDQCFKNIDMFHALSTNDAERIRIEKHLYSTIIYQKRCSSLARLAKPAR